MDAIIAVLVILLWVGIGIVNFIKQQSEARKKREAAQGTQKQSLSPAQRTEQKQQQAHRNRQQVQEKTMQREEGMRQWQRTPEQRPTVTPAPKRPKPGRWEPYPSSSKETLTDWMNRMLEADEEAEPKPVRKARRKIQEVVEEETPAPQVKVPRKPPRGKVPLPSPYGRPRLVRKDVFQPTDDPLLNAIVAGEIIGPPLAKRSMRQRRLI